jgi:hypothetical protein
MSDDVKTLLIILITGGGFLVTVVSLVIAILKLTRGWVDKALAKHYLFEHVLDKGTGETTKTRLIRCDARCPVLHSDEDRPGRYSDVRTRPR